MMTVHYDGYFMFYCHFCREYMMNWLLVAAHFTLYISSHCFTLSFLAMCARLFALLDNPLG